MRATRELVEANGFAAVTEDAVIKKSGVSERVYREQYKDLHALLRKFIAQNDYWLGDLNIGIFDTLGIESFFRETCLNLMYALYNDRVMQRMLIWELDSDNEITRAVANLRETTNRTLVRGLEKHAEASGADVPALVALLVSGIYYTVLHSERSTFCGVDFSTPKGKKRLAGAINFMARAVFERPPPPAIEEPKLRVIQGEARA